MVDFKGNQHWQYQPSNPVAAPPKLRARSLFDIPPASSAIVLIPPTDVSGTWEVQGTEDGAGTEQELNLCNMYVNMHGRAGPDCPAARSNAFAPLRA